MRFLPPQPPTPTLSLFPEAPSPAPTASPTSAHGHSSPFSRPCRVCRGAADPPRPLGELSLTFAYCLHRFGPRNLKESLTSVDSCTGDAPGAGPHWGGGAHVHWDTRRRWAGLDPGLPPRPRGPVGRRPWGAQSRQRPGSLPGEGTRAPCTSDSCSVFHLAGQGLVCGRLRKTFPFHHSLIVCRLCSSTNN